MMKMVIKEYLEQARIGRKQSKVSKKLAKSYALDAIDWFEPEKEHKAMKGEVTKFLNAASEALVESRPSVGLGTDFRLESRKITGFALALDDQILHLSIFVREDGRDSHVSSSKMRRLSTRRRNRL